MSDIINISEREETFKPHTSLLDTPTTYENPLIKVCIFYLSRDGKLGGDAFRVKADKTLSFCLLEDIEGEGSEGRKKITHLLPDLDRLVEAGYSRKFDEASIVQNIVGLDKKVHENELIALSFARISADGKIYYLTSGENSLIAQKRGIISDLHEGRIPKIGIIKYAALKKGTPEAAEVIIHEDRLERADRLLICTDGVTMPIGRFEEHSKRIRDIKYILGNSDSIEEVIARINKSAYEQLMPSKGKPSDDYTIIAIERK